MIDKYKKLIDMCKNITCGRVENIRQSVETITKRQETTATAYNASCLSNIFSSCVVDVGDDNDEDCLGNCLGEDIEEDRVDIWHSSP